MLTVVNAQYEKASFKRMFCRETSVNLSLIPMGNGFVLLQMQNDNYCYTVKCKDNTPIRFRLNIPNVAVTDCVFDLLFNTTGFYIAIYKPAYSDLRVHFNNAYNFNAMIEDNPVDGYISQVIFKTKRRSTSFMLPCNNVFQMIEDD